jgi:predicted secreted protein
MDLVFSISVYLVIWWTVLFAVLPLGVKSHHESGIPVPGGGEPGSPVNPRLLRKFFTTTWISAIVFGVVWVCFTYHLVKLPPLQG